MARWRLTLRLETPAYDGATQVRAEVSENQCFIVGQVEACHLRIRDDSVGRKHFAFEVTNDAVFVVHLGTSTGTWRNGHEVAMSSPEQVNVGDRIQAGRLAMLVAAIEVLDEG